MPQPSSSQQDEKEILSLASIAPGGHNTQPWLVKYPEPYHWIIGNDTGRWLPAVDSAQLLQQLRCNEKNQGAKH